jgi:hypothetical protein
MLRTGADPITKRRIEGVRTMIFEQCAEEYIAAHEGGWRSEKHKA